MSCRLRSDASHSFSSSLLPSTPETLKHVLTRASIRVTPPAHLQLPSMDISPPETSAAEPSASEANVDPAFTRLLGETANIIASPNFSRVLEAALDHVSEEVLLSGLLSNVFGRISPDDAEAAEEPVEPKMRLAAMLPGLARWSRLALTGLPNELVDVSYTYLLCRHHLMSVPLSDWASYGRSKLCLLSYFLRLPLSVA
jgi:peroxin-3